MLWKTSVPPPGRLALSGWREVLAGPPGGAGACVQGPRSWDWLPEPFGPEPVYGVLTLKPSEGFE